MEIKMNPEIRDYKESVFFGLNLRQLIFAGLAVVVAVVLYFCLRDTLDTEMLSWVIMIGALPFGVVGFVKINNMSADRYIIAFIRSEFLMPSKLIYETEEMRRQKAEQTALKKEKSLLTKVKRWLGGLIKGITAKATAIKAKNTPDGDTTAEQNADTASANDTNAAEQRNTEPKERKWFAALPFKAKDDGAQKNNKPTKEEKRAEFERERAERPKPIRNDTRAAKVRTKALKLKLPPTPHTAQDAIPIKRVWRDGIALLKNGKYAKLYAFSDINYHVASSEDKKSMFFGYSDILNSFDADVEVKLTIYKRKIKRKIFEELMFIAKKGDKYDKYRDEYNKMLRALMNNTNENTTHERYLTLAVNAKDIGDARRTFTRLTTELYSRFAYISSRLNEPTGKEYLRLFSDFFSDEDNERLNGDVYTEENVADVICPESFKFASDYIRIGKSYARVLQFHSFASFLEDDFLHDVCSEINRKMAVSIDIETVATDEAARMLENILLGVETDIANYLRKQNQNQNYTTDPPYDLNRKRAEVQEMLDDIRSRNQRMIMGNITIVHTADTPEQLDNDTKTLIAAAGKALCTLSAMKYRQYDGFNTALPYGSRQIYDTRTFITETTAVFMPFRAQELMDDGGSYYGVNEVSRNLLIINRASLKNANGFILGVSGSGKSMSAKKELITTLLATGDHVIILDPQNEYKPIVDAFGGAMVELSPTSDYHINALDLSLGYGDNANPIIAKVEFMMSFFEQLVGTDKLGQNEKSLIDRCLTNIYEAYFKSDYTIDPPTLVDLYNDLLLQPEDDAKQLALKLESVSIGNLNMFAHQTNVNMKNRLVAFGIRELGTQMRNLGMLVITDAIRNRVAANRSRGICTHVFIDEMHIFFRNTLSAEFFAASWKQFRKDNAVATGITQNIEDCLQSVTGRTMLANSEFMVLLSQGPTDCEQLAKLLRISENQLNYIKDVGVGRGLIKCGSNMVPFYDNFPKDTELYRLMSTKPNEFENVI